MPRPLILLGEVDSTQAFLERHPELGFCGVLAGAQTQGRGQRGNTWTSALDQGLWLSAALPVPDLPPGLVPQWAMAAVAEVLARSLADPRGAAQDGPREAREDPGPALGLKWPNDLVAFRGGVLVKLGGIIGLTKGGRTLLGVGVNLRSAPRIPGRLIPPGCLADLVPGPLPDPADLAPGILAAWEHLVPPPASVFRWPAPGDAVRWEEGEGVCEAWLADGRLAVRTRQGVLSLTAGELVGMAAG